MLKFFKNSINFIFNRKIKIIGTFNDWKTAIRFSSGYNDPVIIRKKKESLEKVLKKEAKFERDSFLFYKEYPDKVLISTIKKLCKKKITICDFGGSFASLYFQNINFLDKKKICWKVVEQKKIVNIANKKIKINNLFFFDDIKEVLKKKVDLVIFSSVLQYLEYPYDLLREIANKKINNVIILRTLFHDGPELIKIQVVPKHIYPASYPIRIFNRNKFLKTMKNYNYKIANRILTSESLDGFCCKGYFFKKINHKH